MNCSCEAIFFLIYFSNQMNNVAVFLEQAASIADSRTRDEGRNNYECAADKQHHIRIAGPPSVSLPETFGKHRGQFAEVCPLF